MDVRAELKKYFYDVGAETPLDKFEQAFWWALGEVGRMTETEWETFNVVIEELRPEVD